MVLQISCYPCGAILLRTKKICFKHMRKLVSVKVDYMLGNLVPGVFVPYCACWLDETSDSREFRYRLDFDRVQKQWK